MTRLPAPEDDWTNIAEDLAAALEAVLKYARPPINDLAAHYYEFALEDAAAAMRRYTELERMANAERR